MKPMTQATSNPMNSGDPLAQLRDIHLPEPGGFWPPAPGWWIVAALILVLVGALVFWLWRRHQRNRWLRAARAELDQLGARAEASPTWFTELNALLKRCARQRYPEQRPHALSGAQWRDFLTHTQKKLDPQAVNALVEAAWSPSPAIDPQAAHSLAARWLGGQKC